MSSNFNPSPIPVEYPTASEESNASPTTFDSVVQVMASYDMGWSTRGTVRDYDSLNGFGSIVGLFS